MTIKTSQPYRDVVERGDAASTSSAIPLADTEPPPYTDEDAEVRQESFSRLLVNDYHVPESTLSSDNKTTTTLLPILSSSANALREFIKTQAGIPPKPMIHIYGTHTETVHQDQKTKKNTIVDFDIRMDLTNELFDACGQSWHYLHVPDDQTKAYRGGRMKSLGTGESLSGSDVEDVVDYWCQRYCDDKTPLKT
jgi:hypothetical protein